MISYLNPNLQLFGIWLIGRSRRRSGTPILRQFLIHAKSSKLRWEAATALGLLGGDRALRILLTALKEEKDADLRAAAAYGLSVMSDERATDALLELLQCPGESVDTRAQAAEGLAYCVFGMDRRKRPFRRTVNALVEALKEKAPEVRFSATFALDTLRVVR